MTWANFFYSAKYRKLVHAPCESKDGLHIFFGFNLSAALFFNHAYHGMAWRNGKQSQAKKLFETHPYLINKEHGPT